MAVVGPRADRAATAGALRRVLVATSGLTAIMAIQYVWQLRNFAFLLPASPFVLPAMLLVGLPWELCSQACSEGRPRRNRHGPPGGSPWPRVS